MGCGSGGGGCGTDVRCRWYGAPPPPAAASTTANAARPGPNAQRGGPIVRKYGSGEVAGVAHCALRIVQYGIRAIRPPRNRPRRGRPSIVPQCARTCRRRSRNRRRRRSMMRGGGNDVARRTGRRRRSLDDRCNFRPCRRRRRRRPAPPLDVRVERTICDGRQVGLTTATTATSETARSISIVGGIVPRRR